VGLAFGLNRQRGVVAILEVARALHKLKLTPKRTIRQQTLARREEARSSKLWRESVPEKSFAKSRVKLQSRAAAAWQRPSILVVRSTSFLLDLQRLRNQNDAFQLSFAEERSATGKRATTRVPFPSDSICKLPPNCLTLSRIPRIPTPV
jgi:hypothetical protein